MSEEIERRFPAPPIHPLSALTTIALDGIFAVPELILLLDPLLLPVVGLGVGLLGFAATSLVQHYIAKEEWGMSMTKGLVMGIVSGVPYPVVGTAVGAPLLVWAGLHQFIRLPGGGNNQIVDDAISQPRLENKDGQ